MKFKYTYKTRGFSIGCQLKNFVEIKQKEHKIETIFYDRELTEKEIKNKYRRSLSRTVEIEALEIVLEKYNNEEIILDDSDYSGQPIINHIKR